MTCGCNLAGRLGSRNAQVPVAPIQQSTGKVDSLWNSSMPADTLFLAREVSPAEESLLAGGLPARRGPASVEVLNPDSVWGWRVQLASSSQDGRKVLEALVNRVEREFGSRAYIDCQGNGCALRIGAYDDMKEARSERDRAISYGYKNAWIVQTKIPLHQFISEE